MPVKKTLITKQGQKGLSLIELLISIALGLLILAAATAMTVKSLVMNTDTLASARLNQELDAVSQVMVNDIRRAGFTGGEFFYGDNEDLFIAANDCVLYSYDANEDGVKDDNEKFGFRLNGSVVEMRTTCTGNACATATDCNPDTETGTWIPLTDEAFTTIMTLSFNSEKSKCISLTANPTAINKNNYWVTSIDSGAIKFPCMTDATNSDETDDLVIKYLDSDNIYQTTTTFTAPQGGDRLIEARQVNVTIEGKLESDDGNIRTKKQVVAINARNDHIYCFDEDGNSIVCS